MSDMTDEMILVPRAELLAWAKAWLDDYGPNDGTDCVTPFDTYLMKAPVEAQDVGEDAPLAWHEAVAYMAGRHDGRKEAQQAASLERAERMEEALRLIAAPPLPDGTWNKGREACRQIAEEALTEKESAN